MINIFYASETNDNVAKKQNKLIADAAKATIKNLGFIEVYSSKTGTSEMRISNAENITPYWGGVSFELDDEMSQALFEVNGVVKEIVMGYINDPKKEGETIRAIEKIIV